MATPNPSIAPMVTTNAAGLFSVTESGAVQGVAHPDPATRFTMAQGSLNSTETLPMWGGVAIYEDIPAATADSSLGGLVGRAANLAAHTGFSTFDQAYAGLQSPGSPVPTLVSGMTVNFYRFGSGVRLWVAADPALVSLDGGLITQQTLWDYTNQKLIAYTSGTALPVKVLKVVTTGAKTVSYNSVTNVATWATSSNAVALILI